jgi:hypothetical protein
MNPFDRAGVAADMFGLEDDFSINTGRGYNTLIRLIAHDVNGVPEDVSEEDAPEVGAVTIFAGNAKVAEGSDEYQPVTWAEAIERAVNPRMEPGSEGYVTFDQVSAGVATAMAGRNKGTEESPDYGNVFVNNAVAMINHLQDDEVTQVLDGEAIFAEVIPVQVQSVVGDSFKLQKQTIAMPYNKKRAYTKNDGTPAINDDKYMAYSNIVLRSFNPNNRGWEIGKMVSSVAPVDARESHEGKGEARRLVSSYIRDRIPTVGTMTSRASTVIPGLNAYLNQKAAEKAKKFAPDAQNNNEQSHAPTQEAEGGAAPSM